jgi:hypothetical protein
MVSPSTRNAFRTRVMRAIGDLERWYDRLDKELEQQKVNHSKWETDEDDPVTLKRGDVKSLARDILFHFCEIRRYSNWK